jgi:thioredoxin reductase
VEQTCHPKHFLYTVLLSYRVCRSMTPRRYGGIGLDYSKSIAIDVDNCSNVEEDGIFSITTDNETSIKAKKVVLAVGYHDVYPDIPGFVECWADTIIPCPFCDGYENRDRVWGIVVNSKVELEKFPKMAQNWTSQIKVFIPPNIEIKSSYQNELSKLDIPVYRGIIINVNHTNTKVESVSSQAKKSKLIRFFGYLQKDHLS